MHPALGIQNLERVPGSLHNFAVAAYHGSSSALREIMTLLLEDRLRADQALLLPIVYHNLRPPTHPQHSFERSDHPRAIAARITIGILGVMRKILPRPALLEIWPRYWSWLQLVHPIETDNPADQEPALLGLILIISEVCFDVDELRKLSYTPRLRVYIGRAWNILLPARINDPSYARVWRTLWLFVRGTCGSRETGPTFTLEQLQEYIDGAGGVPDFVSLILRHISLYSRGREQDADGLDTVFYFLTFIYSDAAPLREELSSRGFVECVTKALAAFPNLTARFPQVFIPCCLKLILAILTPAPVHPTVKRAVEAGIIPILVQYSMRRDAHEFADAIRQILAFLTTACVYPSVLRPLLKSMRRLEHTFQSPQFQHSPVQPHWISLASILQRHFSVMEELEGAGAVKRRACDNFECGKLADEREFRRCAACKCMYYCCVECQSHDWIKGGHREECGSLRDIRRDNLSFLTSRQKLFILALVSRQYPDQHASLQVDDNNKHDFFVHFNFHDAQSYLVDGRSNPRIFELTDSDNLEGYPGMQEMVKRASRSHGCMVPILVSINAGPPKFCSNHVILRRSRLDSEEVVHSFLI
ncbi:hypothetical protein R3P38DRAFT_3267547 [Favolaschia claudopus]|uniref:MYND-type domain-containing protein n=1 Tax=Favolaschia claudopus TaxID=2862362 RepID=A0AAW0BPY6_9AGAR